MSAQITQSTNKAKNYAVVDLTPDQTTTDGFIHIMDNILEHIRANIEAAHTGDPEGIHQLRIGIRRARSALRMFKSLMSKNENIIDEFDKRMRRYANIFGQARDWDVFVTKTLNNFPNADKVREQAVRYQTEAHSKVTQALIRSREQNFEDMLDRIASWSREVRIKASYMKKSAPILLDRMAKRVKSRRRNVSLKDEEALHRLRRSVKQLRYGIEHVNGLYGNSKAGQYHHDIKSSLDLLSDLNDAAVTHILADRLKLTDKRTKKWLNRQHRKALKKVPNALHNLRLKPYW